MEGGFSPCIPPPFGTATAPNTNVPYTKQFFVTIQFSQYSLLTFYNIITYWFLCFKKYPFLVA